MSSTDTEWLEFWYTALSSKNGVVLLVDDVALGKARLYRARAAAQDPSLMSIQIRTSPDNPTTELWLVKGSDGQTS
jgi:hypothetical protein